MGVVDVKTREPKTVRWGSDWGVDNGGNDKGMGVVDDKTRDKKKVSWGSKDGDGENVSWGWTASSSGDGMNHGCIVDGGKRDWGVDDMAVDGITGVETKEHDWGVGGSTRDGGVDSSKRDWGVDGTKRDGGVKDKEGVDNNKRDWGVDGSKRDWGVDDKGADGNWGVDGSKRDWGDVDKGVDDNKRDWGVDNGANDKGVVDNKTWDETTSWKKAKLGEDATLSGDVTGLNCVSEKTRRMVLALQEAMDKTPPVSSLTEVPEGPATTQSTHPLRADSERLNLMKTMNGMELH
jgi:hypothetical protein